MTPEGRRVVVVTGGSAGVGRATVRRFAKSGASIGVLARDPERLEKTRQEIAELGTQAVVVPTDVSSVEQLEAAADRIESELGPIDVWINNAMVSVFSPAIAMTPDEFRRVTDVTYLGVVYGTLTALRRMLPRDTGTIVQVGSALAYRGIPLQSAYCAAKHAMEGFCDSLRAELLHDDSAVQVTMVHLPALNTPQFDWVKSRLPRRAKPVPPIFQPEVAADAIVWAAKHPRREYFVGFPTIEAIVGDRVAAGLADRYLARHGYDAQQASEPEDSQRPHNLWSPVDDARDFGAHGRFDSSARSTSLELVVSKHHRAFAALGVALAAATLVYFRRAAA